MRAAATACLESMRKAAEVTEAAEKGSINELVARVVSKQVMRVEYKMRQLDEMAALLRHERSQLERMRHEIFAERLSLEKRRIQQSAGVPATSGYTAVQVGGMTAASTEAGPGSSQPVK